MGKERECLSVAKACTAVVAARSFVVICFGLVVGAGRGKRCGNSLADWLGSREVGVESHLLLRGLGGTKWRFGLLNGAWAVIGAEAK